MNNFTKINLCLVTLLFAVVSCDSDADKTATITIKSTTQYNSPVKLSLFKNLDQVTLIESVTDSAGYSLFEIGLNEPTFALIQIGEKYGELYLAPGYMLCIKENGQDYKIPLTFSGKGADVNNYVSWVNSNVEAIKWAYGKGPADLEFHEFQHRFDSLKTTIANFHESYLDSVAVPDHIIPMLEYKNQIKFSAAQQEFKFFTLNDLYNKQWQAYRSGQQLVSPGLVKELAPSVDDVRFESSSVVTGSGDYENLLNFYWRNNIYLPVLGELVGPHFAETKIPNSTDSRIKKAGYPDALRESLLAFNVKFWLNQFGITAQTDSIYANFKETYQKSRYRAALNKTYNEFLALAPGSPAPEFKGLTTEGDSISIKELRGKITYVDVWATWCRPCIAEIPSSIKLQQKLAKEESIQFLNVSVDSNNSDWKEFLKKNNNWAGIHIIIDPAKINSLYKTYKFSGIPAYFLIDKAGNIINLKAPRPSDENIEMDLRKLLAEQL